MIDTDNFSVRLRERSLDPVSRSVRLAILKGSDQEADLTAPTNADGFGRTRHFRRHTAEGWPDNPLPIDPAARSLGLEPADLLEAQVFQNATCNWRCWYCYVPFELLGGHERSSRLVPVTQTIDWTLQAGAHVLDLSGGQPDLAPEWTLWTLEELDDRGIDDVYVWADDNLSNDYLYRYLDASQVDYLAHHPRHGRVGCFKGYDHESFAFNTDAEPRIFDRQFEIMERHIDHGFDVYAYATFTGPAGRKVEAKMSEFVDRLQAIRTTLPLRTVPLRVEHFTPTDGRLQPDHIAADSVQDDAIACWSEEIQRRFTPRQRSALITEVQF